ncbi:MAG: hypothetical protein EB084_11095 [Proteobacteria bacterium]|nr:hypothetical protein [Pseudomonadota bacterium]
MRFSDVLDRLESLETLASTRERVAPCDGARHIRVETGALVWRCRVEEAFQGWGVFTIGTDRVARLVREASHTERQHWLNGRPRCRLVLLENEEGQTRRAWCEHAGSSGDRREGARVVRVSLTHGLSAYESIDAVFDGERHWSLGLDPTVPPWRAERLRTQLTSSRLALSGQESLMLVDDEQVTHHLALALALGSGELLSWQRVLTGFLVSWAKEGEHFRTLVDEHLSVKRAGLCLSGLDADHDLTTLASLIGRER